MNEISFYFLQMGINKFHNFMGRFKPMASGLLRQGWGIGKSVLKEHGGDLMKKAGAALASSGSPLGGVVGKALEWGGSKVNEKYKTGSASKSASGHNAASASCDATLFGNAINMNRINYNDSGVSYQERIRNRNRRIGRR